MRLFLDDPNAIKQLVQTVSITSSASNSNSNNILTRANSTDSRSNDCSQIITKESLSSSINEIIPTNTNKSKSRSKLNKDRSRQQIPTKPLMPPYQLSKIPLPSKLLSIISFFFME